MIALALAALAIAAIALAARKPAGGVGIAIVPVADGGGASPLPVPPIDTSSPGGATGPGSALGIAPVIADPATPGVHALTAADLLVPVSAFALGAGYSTVDAMVDSNPHLRLIVGPPDKAWPPLDAPFDYVIHGPAGVQPDVYTFAPTGRIDRDYDVPTCTNNGVEWVFPLWDVNAIARPDLEGPRKAFEGSAFVRSTGTDGVAFGSPLGMAPWVRWRGIAPWVVGTKIAIVAAPVA